MSQPGDPHWLARGPALLAILAVAVAVALRTWGLENDPVHHSWVGWQHDEGRWTETARAWVLFGTVETGNAASTLHLALAPLWQAVSAAFFSVTGVGFREARLPSALAGCAIVALLAVGLRGWLPRWALAVGVLLAACNPALVYFSRVAIPEMTALFFQLLAFLVLVRAPGSRRSAVGAGLLALLALGTKATTAPAVLGMCGALLVMHRGEPGQRRRDAITFALVVGVPIGLAGIVAAFLVPSPSRLIDQLLGFVAPTSPQGIAATLYTSGRGISRGDASAVNLLLAGVWTAGVCLLPLRPARSVSEPERIFRGAVVWAAGSFAAWALLDYFPDRWVVHVHLPLVIALVSGIASIPSGAPPATGGDGASSGARLRGVLLLLPVSIVFAGWTVAFIGRLGLDLDRIRWHLPLIAGTLLLTALWARRGADRAYLLSAIGLLALLGWRLLAGPLPLDRFWTTGEDALALWSIALVDAAAIAYLLPRITGRARGNARLVVPLWALAVGLGPIWLVSETVGRPPETRVLAEVATRLEERYPPGTVIGVDGAATVMLETPWPYRELPTAQPLPDVLVVMMGGGWGRPESEAAIPGFDVVYEIGLPRVERGVAEPASIRIYERVGGPGEVP